MTLDDARAAVAARLATAMTASYALVPVQYENLTQVDLAAQTKPFVSMEIIFNDGEQKSMGDKPVGRFSGAVWLGVWCKEGSGTKTALTLLSFLIQTFRAVSFGGVVCHMPVPVPAQTKLGWFVEAIRVPFYFDDIPA